MAERPVGFAWITLSLLYSGSVFLAGLLFGVLRALWVAPWLGERLAELVEFPFMLIVMVLAARIVVRRSSGQIQMLLIVGVLSGLAVLMFDLLLGLWIREMTLKEILFERDLLTGSIYYLMIGVMALLPAGLVAHQRRF